MALFWFVLLLAAGEVGLLTALLVWSNATVAGLLGGRIGSRTG